MPTRRCVQASWAASVVLVLLLAACPAPEPPGDDPTPPAVSPADPDQPAVTLGVVATMSGLTDQEDVPFVEGMELALREVNEGGGVGGRPLELDIADDEGRPRQAQELLEGFLEADGPEAVLVVGEGEAVTALRPRIEEAARPVVLLGDDLYTSQRLFRWAFQTAPPLRWQAGVLARYLAEDRDHREVLLAVEAGPGSRARRSAFQDAMADRGVPVAGWFAVGPGQAMGPIAEAVDGADAVAVLGRAPASARVARALHRLDDPPQLAMSSDALTASFASRAGLGPGTVASYAYTWAGWAEPVQRVARFRARFEDAFGRRPVAFEQEGYDTVRLLADALDRTGARSGERLLRELEAVRDDTYSSLPIRLGPDDHVLAEEIPLGLFAVTGAGGDTDPFAPGWAAWRPLMRTFTTDGRRTAILDRDKRTFFPAWRRRSPSPFYWRSRHGITTRPEEDRLH